MTPQQQTAGNMYTRRGGDKSRWDILGNQDNMIQSTRPTPEADNYQTKIGNSLIVDTGLQ